MTPLDKHIASGKPLIKNLQEQKLLEFNVILNPKFSKTPILGVVPLGPGKASDQKVA